MKENKKLKLQTTEEPNFYSLLDHLVASDLWGIYRIEMDKKMSGEIGELAISEFESSPYLQT